ncbi:MAG: hypothetical protein M1825_000162 [Sarcosagium campestre]|nr:MAG: hypothetical protein M1825_000162 [Sarcosagium campestre]
MDTVSRTYRRQAKPIDWRYVRSIELLACWANPPKGTEDENVEPKKLLIKYARQPDMASLFNHASMAHNNHFFFNCLSPNRTSIPPLLEEQLTEDFSSLETLKREFIANGSAMFGPGYVWLVKATDTSKFRLINTYIAGSPYPGAHYRRQPIDMATQNQENVKGLSGEDFARQNNVQNTVGMMGDSSGRSRIAAGGVALIPVLCVNTWEHVWLRDFGVAGKSWFLESWWDKIDWNVVAHNADIHIKRSIRM